MSGPGPVGSATAQGAVPIEGQLALPGVGPGLNPRVVVGVAMTVALVAAFGTLALLGKASSFSFYLMLWIVMATGINIISGFTGYMPLGYAAFFGLGAFATAILTQKLGLPMGAALAGATALGLSVALLFSPTLRLRGVYFAMVSLALAIICRIVIASLPTNVTGGSFGVSLSLGGSTTGAYFAMVALLAAALLAAVWLSQSRLGRALKAIREDPEAAAVMGLDVPRVRLRAWLLAAFFPTVAGGLEAWYTRIVDPETAFQFLTTAKALIYATLGGLGTVVGPVAGTILLVWVDDLIWQRFPILNLFLLGLALVLLVLLMPRGIVGTLLERRPALRRYIP